MKMFASKVKHLDYVVGKDELWRKLQNECLRRKKFLLVRFVLINF